MFQNALYRKSCYEISTKHRSGGGVCIFEITGMYLFASACKTHVLHLTKLTNENIKSTVELYISCRFNTQTLRSLLTSCLCFLLLPVSVTNRQKIFANVSSFCTQKVCDHDRSYWCDMPCVFMPYVLDINSNGIFKQEHVECCSSTTKNIISPTTQCLWLPNLAGW